MIKTVAFDAFGTLVEVQDNRRSFHRLYEAAGRSFENCPMSISVDLKSEWESLGLTDQALFETLSSDLDAEVRSITPFGDTFRALEFIRRAGYAVALASNVTSIFAARLRTLLGPYFEVLHFSCETGFEKPQKQFYSSLCERLGSQPAEVLMVGDSLENDYLAAIESGLQAILMQRSGLATMRDLLTVKYISSAEQLCQLLTGGV